MHDYFYIQVLSGIDMSSYEADADAIDTVFMESVATTLGNGVDPSDVSISNVTAMDTDSTAEDAFGAPPSPTTPTTPASSLNVQYSVQVSHVHGYSDPDAAFAAIAANYTDSVTSGAFTANMQALAVDNGVGSLETAYSNTVNLTLYVPGPTASPTIMNVESQDTFLGTAAFIGLVLLIVLVFREQLVNLALGTNSSAPTEGGTAAAAAAAVGAEEPPGGAAGGAAAAAAAAAGGQPPPLAPTASPAVVAASKNRWSKLRSAVLEKSSTDVAVEAFEDAGLDRANRTSVTEAVGAASGKTSLSGNASGKKKTGWMNRYDRKSDKASQVPSSSGADKV